MILTRSLIRIAPPRSWRRLDASLKRLGAYDVVVFTSKNAVAAVFARARRLRLARLRRPRRVIAVGQATAKALVSRGWQRPETARDPRQEGIAATIGAIRGCRILFPRSAAARAYLARTLRRRGARVCDPICYRPVADPTGLRAVKKALENGKGPVHFASGSAVDAFFRGLGAARARAELRKRGAVAIGPVTAAALRRRGVRA